MEEAEYMELAESVPNDWYTSAESVDITKSIFYDIMIGSSMKYGLVINNSQDMQELVEKISLEKEIPEEDVIMNVKNIATTLGAIKLFNRKYQDIAAKFPKDEYGLPVYPPKFLAKILEVTEDIALDLLGGVLKDYSTYLEDE